MKNHLIFSLFIVSILALCGCTVDSAGGQFSADAETPKSLALGNLGHDSAADMVYVEGGTFQMGGTKYRREMPVHEVTVSSFYIGKYKVTQAEYEKLMKTNPSSFEGEQRPVEEVTWYNAVKYCNKRSKAEGLTPCYIIDSDDGWTANVTCNWSASGYRLPTEAEWEYAARGGKNGSPYTYRGNSRNGTYEGGTKKANALLEIHGMGDNMCEWCWDWYDEYYYSGSAKKDPLGPASGGHRVVRGDGWRSDANYCQCTFRNRYLPSYRGSNLGFRVVRSVIIAADSAADMVLVEGGTFQMGSTAGDDDEQPMHTVRVNNFYMCKYEVTQAVYKTIMGKNPSNCKSDQRPVECVSWYNAVEYCNRRSKAEKLTPCYTINRTNIITCNWSANGYRLPTEAEWEYAARGGKYNSPYKYSGSDNIDEVAWYGKNSGNETHEVGKKKANALGIYDMSGSVYEWCWDWYDEDYYGSSSFGNNPLGPASGDFRVVRGGCWGDNAGDCRCAYRGGGNPSRGGNFIGFRVVRSAGK